ncbi:sulfatase-like hydrolase/transferase [Streptomyces sp. R39]|uniref:Sulfatase-like hydrolase/transferase n=1 Tax=Streptomyces sp. R39 TaxID=3238631 RepID=A0AB39QLC0_9ACTN
MAAAKAEPAEAEPEAGARSEAEPEAGPIAETEAESEAEPGDATKPGGGAEAKAEAKPGGGAKAAAGGKAESDAEAASASDLIPGAAAGPRADTKPETETGPVTEAEARPEAEPKTGPVTEAETEPETEAGGEAETESEAGPVIAAEAGGKGDVASAAGAGALPVPVPEAATPARRPRIWQRWRTSHPTAARVLSIAVTTLSALLVYACLLMPNTLSGLKTVTFVRIPAEAVMGAVVLLSLPRRARLILSALAGAVVGALAVIDMFNMGFVDYLGRPFNIILDWSLLPDARSYLADTLGSTVELAITVGAVLLIFLLIGVVALATVRVSNQLARQRGRATRGTLIVGTVWITCNALGLSVAGSPLAAQKATAVLKTQVRTVQQTLKDEADFRKVAKVDAFGNTPGDQLVPALRGKDVVFTFIESYGRSAIEDPIEAPGVDKTLDAQTAMLEKAGYAAKSGWLTSATYGGSSWLGHSTTMSGLWVSNQQRYRTVMASDHLSLTKAFKKTGDFDTVGVMPGIQKGWPEQSFYGLDKVYNAFQLGYKGPKFSWSTMPDQYALQQFQERVHSKKPADGKSRMSFLILTSSHQPWAPIPKMVPWDQLGDGSVFNAIEKAGNKASDVIADTTKSRQEYGKSVQYTVTALTQWLQRYGNDNTVLVFLGDHQPIARVSGNHASRDVPVSIVAKDPKVLDAISSWNWTDGLRPAHDAPVWKMSAFRDKFLTAYGSTPHPKSN